MMHKKEKGDLNINVLEKGDQLLFTIRDNGIGRAKAKEMTRKTATKHKSMGLKIIQHRIAMMQGKDGTGSPVTINDLVNTGGSAAGTEVVIKMPLIEEA